jgi:HAD superfamily hydrolase (TIGR01549 family)
MILIMLLQPSYSTISDGRRLRLFNITPDGLRKAKEEFYYTANIFNKQAYRTSHLTDYPKYLTKDSRLTDVFARLINYKHYMLVNGSQESVSRGSALLGIDLSVFTEIVTSEVVGETKPGTKGFTYIMQQTGLPAASHLMIGDREAVDLVPAKALGMHTCLVWSNAKSDVADVTLPTVYGVPDVLG